MWSEQIEFVELVFLIEHDIVESSSNRIDCISSSLNRGWFEMVLELLFEYGEHESSSVAQILNVVPETNIDPEIFKIIRYKSMHYTV